MMAFEFTKNSQSGIKEVPSSSSASSNDETCLAILTNDETHLLTMFWVIKRLFSLSSQAINSGSPKPLLTLACACWRYLLQKCEGNSSKAFSRRSPHERCRFRPTVSEKSWNVSGNVSKRHSGLIHCVWLLLSSSYHCFLSHLVLRNRLFPRSGSQFLLTRCCQQAETPV